MFSDIRGFTKLSQTVSPAVMMSMLNKLYMRMDELVQQYRVSKIGTAGDAYIAVSGLTTTSSRVEVLRRLSQLSRGSSASDDEAVSNAREAAAWYESEHGGRADAGASANAAESRKRSKKGEKEVDDEEAEGVKEEETGTERKRKKKKEKDEAATRVHAVDTEEQEAILAAHSGASFGLVNRAARSVATTSLAPLLARTSSARNRAATTDAARQLHLTRIAMVALDTIAFIKQEMSRFGLTMV